MDAIACVGCRGLCHAEAIACPHCGADPRTGGAGVNAALLAKVSQPDSRSADERARDEARSAYRANGIALTTVGGIGSFAGVMIVVGTHGHTDAVGLLAGSLILLVLGLLLLTGLPMRLSPESRRNWLYVVFGLDILLALLSLGTIVLGVVFGYLAYMTWQAVEACSKVPEWARLVSRADAVAVATFSPETAWSGRRIVYCDSRLVLDGWGVINAADVVAYDQSGSLLWADPKVRDWAYQLVELG